MKKNLRFWIGWAVLVFIGYSALPAQYLTAPDAEDIRAMAESLGFDHSDYPLYSRIDEFLKPISGDARNRHPVLQAPVAPARSLLQSIVVQAGYCESGI